MSGRTFAASGRCSTTMDAGTYNSKVVYLDKQYLYWNIHISELKKIFSYSSASHAQLTLMGPTITDGEYKYGQLQVSNIYPKPADFKPIIRKTVGDGFKDMEFVTLFRKAGPDSIELLVRIKRLTYGEQDLNSRELGHNKTQANLGEVLKNGQFSDFTISVSGEEIPVHKVILAQSSKYFQALLSSDMRESRENRLEIVDQKLPIIQAILLYIYTNEVEKSNLRKSIHESTNFYTELLSAAELYQLDRLKFICEEILCELVTKESMDYLEVFAFDHELKMLRKMVCKFIAGQKDGTRKN